MASVEQVSTTTPVPEAVALPAVSRHSPAAFTVPSVPIVHFCAVAVELQVLTSTFAPEPVGVFDADPGQLLLYVNGRLSATKAYTGTDWNAVGPVQFGRRLYQGAYGEYADGRLSDVRLYPTALPPADAAAPGGNATLTQLD
ncbi:LamG-like jellyroll fold domain-containing protein [Streptomyces mirabilis]|uniref:LamG-like jellyroll fold domain-containing protein n=1 Tax=Streptomyces mirabilis TaxID=68239 RepID=UPI0036C92580